MSHLIDDAPSLALATACSERMQKTWMELISTNKQLGDWRTKHSADGEDDLATSDLNFGLELAASLQRLTRRNHTLARLGVRLCENSLRVLGHVRESLAESPVDVEVLTSLVSTVEAHRDSFGRQLELVTKLGQTADQIANGMWVQAAGQMPAGVRAS